MKKLIFALLIVSLNSCVLTSYYQVYKTEVIGGNLKSNSIIFEDNNCIVTYDFWSEGGDVGFNIYNKTENDLIIDLTNTFFVLNGVSYDYYQNRTFTKSSTSGTAVTRNNLYSNNYSFTKAVSGVNSNTLSISYNESPKLTIPSKTSKKISEYKISNSRYEDCNLVKYPVKNDIKPLKFEKDNSPFVFYNLISYSVKDDSARMENNFYVSEIANLNMKDMMKLEKIKKCNEVSNIGPAVSEYVFKDVSPDKFYIKY